ERLSAELVEKDTDLQKWREERDKLVEALEVQIKALLSNAVQKDKEIAELKEAALKDSGKNQETDIEELRKQLAEKDGFIKELKNRINNESLQSLAEVPLPEEEQNEIDHSVNKEFMEKQSKASPVAGQSIPARYDEVTENHSLSQCPSSISSLSEDFVKSENKKNAKPPMTNSPSTSNKKMSLRKEYSLRKQDSTLSKKSGKKKDGTLQKIGDFFQSSPTIIHSKAKKLMATISSPKSAEPQSVKENEPKPKRTKRKLYTTDISNPVDIPTSSTFIEQKEKESDHLIVKRRLRSKPVK
ncbi:KI20B protein, partial [Podargus strigoides]|nr:KI20B protein [Podargus strigoides]